MSSALGTESTVLAVETYWMERLGRRREDLGTQTPRVAEGHEWKGERPGGKRVTCSQTLHTEKHPSIPVDTQGWTHRHQLLRHSLIHRHTCLPRYREQWRKSQHCREADTETDATQRYARSLISRGPLVPRNPGPTILSRLTLKHFLRPTEKDRSRQLRRCTHVLQPVTMETDILHLPRDHTLQPHQIQHTE